MSTNDVTGDELITKATTDSYREGWERIFGNKKRPCTCHPDDSPPEPCAEQYALGECLAKKALSQR